MTRAEKRGRVLQLLAEHPEASDREIGRLAGVSPTTVGKVRLNLSRTVAERAIADSRSVDIDTAPLSTILRRIMAWPEERRVELLSLLDLAVNGPGQEPLSCPWNRKYTAEQRAGVIAAAKRGLSATQAGALFGVERASARYMIVGRKY